MTCWYSQGETVQISSKDMCDTPRVPPELGPSQKISYRCPHTVWSCSVECCHCVWVMYPELPGSAIIHCPLTGSWDYLCKKSCQSARGSIVSMHLFPHRLLSAHSCTCVLCGYRFEAMFKPAIALWCRYDEAEFANAGGIYSSTLTALLGNIPSTNALSNTSVEPGLTFNVQ